MFTLGYFVEALLYVTLALLMGFKIRVVWNRRGELKRFPFDFYGAIFMGVLGVAAFIVHVNKAVTQLF